MHFPKDINKDGSIPGLKQGKITRFFRHSDNAGSHFKNTGAIHYFTTLIDGRGGPGVASFVYTFGAPGHGKGPFDGLGGAFKNKIASLIRSAMMNGMTIPGTNSGYINTIKDVFSALVAYFEDGEARDDSRAKIDKFKFFLYEETDQAGIVPRPNEVFATLQSITKQYQIVVDREGFVYTRRRQCWCLQCYAAFIEGTLEWGSDKCIPCCEKTNLGGLNGQGLMYKFFKAAASKTSGPGSSIPRAPDMRHRHEKAAALAVGDWVIFDGNGDEDEPFWLGRVMSNPEWGGSGVKVNNTNSLWSYQNDELRVQPNEVAINLMWYELRDIAMSSKKYRVSRTDLNSVVNNNFYMIMGGPEVNDKMHRMVGESNPVPRNRTGQQVIVGRSFGSYSVPRGMNFQRLEQDWYNREKPSVWQMHDCLRENALMRCVT